MSRWSFGLTRSRAAAVVVLLMSGGCQSADLSTPVATPSPATEVSISPEVPGPRVPAPAVTPLGEAPLSVHGAAGPALYWNDLAGVLHQALWSDLVDRSVGSGRALQSPDGSRLAGPDDVVVTSDGTAMGAFPGGGALIKPLYSWADDNRHLCAVDRFEAISYPVAATLSVAVVGRASSAVAKVGYNADRAGPRVMSCSFGSGRAIVTETCVNRLCELWTVNLADGAILGDLKPDGTGASAARDGSVVAVSGSIGGRVTFIDPVSGSVLASVPGEWGGGFSGDSKLAVVADRAGTRVVEWRTGRVVWTGPPTVGRDVAGFPEPGAGRIALTIQTTSAYPYRADVYVVAPDGSSTRLATDVTPAF